MAYKVASLFEVETVRDGYKELCETVLRNGATRAPRGLEVKELRGVTVVVNDPTTDAMPHGIGRNLNLAIGAAEALQLLGGVSYPQMMVKISGTFNRFMDGEVLAGAYGPRIRPQLDAVYRRLLKDPDTRQAVLMIWDPLRDLMVDSLDIPCTLGMQFFINEDQKLECHTVMRSNDLWWGFGYDVFQFACLQQALASSLDIEPGPLVHRANSFHLYARDYDKVEALDDSRSVEPLRPAIASRTVSMDVNGYAQVARDILTGKPQVPASYADRDGWFQKTLAPYVGA